MDPGKPPPPVYGGGEVLPVGVGGACGCTSCLCCGSASFPSAAWRRSLKRKLEELEAGFRTLTATMASGDGDGVARVEIENEAVALREALASHQQSIKELNTELDEERSASASAATEAMSMILRLQREKAEAQMEARQFKRFAEEKMAHDQQEIASLEDLLFKREQAIQALTCEVQAYRHRLLSYGIGPNGDFSTPSEPQTPDVASATAAANEGLGTPRFDLPPTFDYPPLKCIIPDDDASADVEKYPFEETPREHLQKIGKRIHELERIPSSGRYGSVKEKGVVGFSPRQPKHLRRFSIDSFGSGLEFNKGEEFPMAMDGAFDCGDISDRVCTVDAVHGVSDDYVSTPREIQNRRAIVAGGEEAEIKKLYMRLQVLEADRETMRQAMISMNTDKAQVVLLKEIASQLCKEVKPERRMVKKQSFIKKFSFVSVIKCVISFVFWRKKSSPIKYTFGLSCNNSGLLLLLDKSPRLRHRRFLTRTQSRTHELFLKHEEREHAHWYPAHC